MATGKKNKHDNMHKFKQKRTHHAEIQQQTHIYIYIYKLSYVSTPLELIEEGEKNKLISQFDYNTHYISYKYYIFLPISYIW